MFEYFPENYGWSQSVAIALLVGGNIHEIDEVCQSLKAMTTETEEASQGVWYEGWEKLAERAERLAALDQEAGHYLSAGRKYLSAACYHILAERHVTNQDPRKIQAYEKALDTFSRGVELGRERVERVEIPYQGASLPALFLPSADSGRGPCMIFFNGGDSIKELLYFVVRREFRRRGISVLIVDNPGAGEALRLRNQYSIPESEFTASACVDYLEGRSDVDPDRIGVMGLSMGGYHAPRSAAFEKRLKCCVAWGIARDVGWFFSSVLKGESETTGLAFQLAWMFGKDTPQEAVEIAKKMTLKGVADKITCPFLIVHGENDRFSPARDAEITIEEAVNSQKRELKVFTPADGGVEHCQVDNNSLAIEYMSDWIADTLGSKLKG